MLDVLWGLFYKTIYVRYEKDKIIQMCCDNETTENLSHFILHCQMYDAIRNQYVPKYIEMNRNVTQVAEDETMLMISIFDPLSSKLPANITSNWS